MSIALTTNVKRLASIAGASAVALAGALSFAPAASAEGCSVTQYNMYCESIMGWISCDYDTDGTQINCEAGRWTVRDPRPDKTLAIPRTGR